MDLDLTDSAEMHSHPISPLIADAGGDLRSATLLHLRLSPPPPSAASLPPSILSPPNHAPSSALPILPPPPPPPHSLPHTTTTTTTNTTMVATQRTASPIHPASLLDSSSHSPAILEMIETDMSRTLIGKFIFIPKSQSPAHLSFRVRRGHCRRNRRLRHGQRFLFTRSLNIKAQ